MSRQIAVVDAVVIRVDDFYKSGTLKILEPLRAQLGFGYILFEDSEVQTLPLGPLPVGRLVNCEVWTPTRTNAGTPGKHHARNIHVYAEEKVQEVKEKVS
jgi:hypothetical protein